MKKNNFDNLLLNMSFFFLLILIKPGIIYNYPSINDIFNYGMMIISFVMIIVFLFDKNKSKIMMYISFLFFSLFTSTLLFSNDVGFFLKNFMPMYGLSIYVDHIMKTNCKKALNRISSFMFIMIIVNFISILLLPHNTSVRENRIFFLGYDNVIAPLIITGASIILINNRVNNKKNLNSVFIILITFLSCILIYSSSATVGGVVYILLIILSSINNKRLNKIINYNLFFMISIIIFVGFVFFSMQNHFSFFIENILHRDVTLTSRTVIWDLSIKYIKMSPILGNGVLDPDISHATIGLYHSHNTILHYLFMGGFVGLSIYFINLFFVGKTINGINDKKIKLYLTSSFCVYFILSITEYFVRSHFLFIAMIVSYYLMLTKGEENRK